jgi:hypothetical protein
MRRGLAVVGRGGIIFCWAQSVQSAQSDLIKKRSVGYKAFDGLSSLVKMKTESRKTISIQGHESDNEMSCAIAARVLLRCYRGRKGRDKPFFARDNKKNSGVKKREGEIQSNETK